MPCTVCGSYDLTDVLDFGKQALCNAFLSSPLEFASEKKYPLILCVCGHCQLVQLRDVLPRELVFGKDFNYLSSSSKGVAQYYKELAKRHYQEFHPSRVLEIACLPEANIICGDDYQVKDISEVQVGERVLSLEDNAIVTKTYSKDYQGELICLRVRGYPFPLRFTPNHPIPTIRDVYQKENRAGWQGKQAWATFRQERIESQDVIWKQASQLDKDDLLFLPALSRIALLDEDSQIEIGSHLDCRVISGKLHTLQVGRGGYSIPSQNETPLPQFVSSTNFASFIGYYLSEGSGFGHSKESGIRFSFGNSLMEFGFISEVSELAKNIFGLNVSISRGNGETSDSKINSALLEKIMRGYCGNNAREKHIPSWIMVNERSLVACLRTLFNGDGSVVLGSQVYAKFDTVSKHLAHQIWLALWALGVECSIMPNAPRGYGKKNGKTLYSVRIFAQHSLLKFRTLLKSGKVSLLDSLKLTTRNSEISYWPQWRGMRLTRSVRIWRESYSGKVYNLETTDHTYSVGIATHNSNDGCYLRHFPKDVTVLGIDPAPKAVELARQVGVESKCGYFENVEYFTEVNTLADFHPDLICAFDVLAHAEKLHLIMWKIVSLMSKETVLIAQFHSLKAMVEKTEYDCIYHEHLRYFSLPTFSYLLGMFGLRVCRWEETDFYGGSIIVYARKGEPHIEGESVRLWDFAKRVKAQARELKVLLTSEKLKGKRIVAVSMPMKAATLLNYSGIDSSLIEFATETNPLKQGMFSPGSHVPVYPDSKLLEEPQADLAVILSWNLFDEISARLRSLGFRGSFLNPNDPQRVSNPEITDSRTT